MPGIFGDTGIGPVERPLDVSFDKIWDALESGAMGTVRVGYGRWALTTDAVYLTAGGSEDVGVGPRDVVTSFDFKQTMVEPTLSYRICTGFEVLAGARWNDIEAEINGPLGRNPSGKQAWWDPLVGANLSLPLGKGFSANLRGDIGGFGVNSDLTWQAYPYLDWKFAKWDRSRLATASFPSITKTTVAADRSNTTCSTVVHKSGSRFVFKPHHLGATQQPTDY